MVVLLIILGIVGIVVYRYVEKQNTIKRLRVHEITEAANASFQYLGSPVVSEAKVQKWLGGGKSAKEIFDAVADELQDFTAETPGWLYLGVRRPNLMRGIELEAEWNNMRESVSRESEYQAVKKMVPMAEAQLDVWHAVSDGFFPVFQNEYLRDRHTYVVGKSGSGKTTLLTWLIYQDMVKHSGVAFLCPERETIEDEIIPYIPDYRLDDVIYFNPADERCKYSFNPLYLDDGEDIDQKVDDVFTSFSRLMEGEGSPRINEILRQTFYALVELPGTTLLDIPRLLDKENPHYRSQVVAQLRDEQTKKFWNQTYNEMPANTHLPILSRLSQFIRPRRIRNILCRPEKGLDFREIMDEGKILLCNLSDGLLGEHASRLLGGLVMSEIQLATMSRADTMQKDRQRFYVYVDEFHSFVSYGNVSYEKLLSRARKYRLPLILAHQQTGQLPTQLVDEIFGNVSTVVSFLVSRKDAQYISREMVLDYSPEKKTAAPEDLVTQEVGEAHVKIGTLAFSMFVDQTLRDVEARWENKRAVIEGATREKAPTQEPAAETVEQTKEGTDDIPPDPFGEGLDPQEVF